MTSWEDLRAKLDLDQKKYFIAGELSTQSLLVRNKCF